ncbi:MAG: glycoside hydrolase family 25 protein, partial [Chloroflexi bacterium]|nr:glycoside hydrolase family 25 protein [Chloroflexota bacterium]
MTPAELPASPQALRALGLAAVIDPAAWAEVPSSQDDPAASTPDPSPSSGASPTPSPTPSLAPRPAPRPAPTPYLPPGIDISRYDGSVDMQLVRSAGVRFVYAKATQGSTIDDTWYADHVAAARAGGIAFGSYHFFDYRQDGVAQADHFVDAMAANGALLDSLPPAVDVECLLSMGQSDRRAARTRLRALVDRVYQRTGRIAMIYTSAHMWAHVTGNDLTFGANPLWVACWSCDKPILPRGWNTWTLWQVGPLRVPGITRRFDGDVAAGGDAAVEALRSRQMVVEDDAPLTTGGAVRLQLQGLDGGHVRTSVDHQTWSDWTPRAAAGRGGRGGAPGARPRRGPAPPARGPHCTGGGDRLV